jgi:hypothetical protein
MPFLQIVYCSWCHHEKHIERVGILPLGWVAIAAKHGEKHLCPDCVESGIKKKLKVWGKEILGWI